MEKKREMMDKAIKFRKEEEEILESELLVGNSHDPDVETIDTDE